MSANREGPIKFALANLTLFVYLIDYVHNLILINYVILSLEHIKGENSLKH